MADRRVMIMCRKPTVPKAGPEVHERLRVLVADDVSANLLLAQKLLEKLGYTAVCVSSGKELIKRLQIEVFDLILMDCQMPEIDGYEATRLIRQHSNPAIREITILALTANAMMGNQERCLNVGMDDYLSNPLKRENLVKMLNRWIGPESRKNPKFRKKTA